MATTLCCYGQDTTALTRTPYKLTVAIDKNAVYAADVKATPYVLPDKTLQLYPGEKVYIEVELANDTIASLKAVRENTNPSKTLIVEFTQSAKKNVHEMMMLKVTNPFAKNLVYKCLFFPLKGSKFVETDVLPVMAGLSGFETWPNIIISIALSDWKFEAK